MALSSPGAPSTMRNSGRRSPRLMRSSRTVRQASALSPPMLLIASNTFWPSAHTPRTTSSEMEVALRSSRTRKVKSDWDAWNARSLAEEPIVRLILDGTVVRVRLDRKATAIVLLVVLGVREDGQKVLLAVKNMGGETSEAWRVVLDDLVKRGLVKPRD